MKRYFTMAKASIYIKFILTPVLFVSFKDVTAIDSFSKLAVALLEFIIILELVRMFIVNGRFDALKIGAILGKEQPS